MAAAAISPTPVAVTQLANQSEGLRRRLANIAPYSGKGRPRGIVNRTTRIHRKLHQLILTHGDKHLLSALDELRRYDVAEYCKLVCKYVPIQVEVGANGNAAAVIIIEPTADVSDTTPAETVAVLPSE